jgi:hypothetical protein
MATSNSSTETKVPFVTGVCPQASCPYESRVAAGHGAAKRIQVEDEPLQIATGYSRAARHHATLIGSEDVSAKRRIPLNAGLLRQSSRLECHASAAETDVNGHNSSSAQGAGEQSRIACR